MMPPAVTHSPSRLPAQLRERAVDRRPQRLAHLLERVRGDEQADRLLLDREQLGLVELLAGDRRVGRRRERGRAAPPPSSPIARSKIEPWPICASSWAFCPAPCACSSTLSMPLRESRSSRTRRTSRAPRSRACSPRAGRRARRSPRCDWNGPPSSRAALIASTAGVADALHGVEAEADVALDDDELVVGEVDVRRQDLDAHLLRLARRRTAPCPSCP